MKEGTLSNYLPKHFHRLLKSVGSQSARPSPLLLFQIVTFATAKWREMSRELPVRNPQGNQQNGFHEANHSLDSLNPCCLNIIVAEP